MDLEKNKVSIVVPVYNVEKYLARCLDSLQKQTYNNREIIFVNDGSTDGSLALLHKFKDQSKCPVKIINIVNSGVSAARNFGAKAAIGDYICFIDADDMLDINYIKYMLSALEKFGKCKLAICKKNIISEEYKEIPANDDELCAYNSRNLKILRKMLYHQLPVGIWCAMIESNFQRENNLYFAEGYKYSEDLELLWRLVIHSEEVVLVDNALYAYRNRRNSAMNSFNPDRRDGYELFLQLEQYIAIHSNDFYEEFKKYGVSYWVWSTLWQAAKFDMNYKKFKSDISFMEPKRYIKQLIKYPNIAVKCSSVIFLACPRLYYIIMHYFYLKRKNYNEL